MIIFFNRLMTRVLFVCLGNICRSPMAEGILSHLAAKMSYTIQVDSAGTGHWHVGEPPDPRAIRCLNSYGIDISGLRARQITEADFHRFDLILAMDTDNLKALQRAYRGGTQPQLFTRFCGLTELEVPDPYYGDERDFEAVYHLLYRGISKILPMISVHA